MGDSYICCLVDDFLSSAHSAPYGGFYMAAQPSATKINMPKIKNVIFNNPATIVMWDDDTKTVVKAGKEKYDAEKGLAMAITKKALGNKGDYYDVIKKWVGDLMPAPDDKAK